MSVPMSHPLNSLAVHCRIVPTECGESNADPDTKVAKKIPPQSMRNNNGSAFRKEFNHSMSNTNDSHIFFCSRTVC
jgi:hypothetical protein